MDRHRRKVKSTKNKQARRFSVEAEILPLLLARCDEAKAAGSTTLIPKMPGVERLSTMFREHLELVGVSRAELFINDKTRKHITFHDLRATGITWMAVRGDEPLKIKHRAGHISFSTTEGYIREAEQVRDGFGDVFPKAARVAGAARAGAAAGPPGDDPVRRVRVVVGQLRRRAGPEYDDRLLGVQPARRGVAGDAGVRARLFACPVPRVHLRAAAAGLPGSAAGPHFVR
jgi:integrase